MNGAAYLLRKEWKEMSFIQIGGYLVCHNGPIFFEQIGISSAFSCCDLESNMKKLADMRIEAFVILDVSNSSGSIGA
jgi:hypothetical protein